jgi:hypothetical protein
VWKKLSPKFKSPLLIECQWSWWVFWIIGKLIVLVLHKWDPFLIFQRKIYFKHSKYVGNVGKIANVIELLCHRSVQSPLISKSKLWPNYYNQATTITTNAQVITKLQATSCKKLILKVVKKLNPTSYGKANLDELWKAHSNELYKAQSSSNILS